MNRHMRKNDFDPREFRATALEKVGATYADLAARPIQRNCTLLAECCNFKLTGSTPYVTKGEALFAAKALRAAGRKELPERTDGACPLLHPRTSRCMIYNGRPFGCRTHFCDAAGGPYARTEVLDLIRRLEEIDEKLGGEGVRKLPEALAEALDELD